MRSNHHNSEQKEDDVLFSYSIYNLPYCILQAETLSWNYSLKIPYENTDPIRCSTNPCQKNYLVKLRSELFRYASKCTHCVMEISRLFDQSVRCSPVKV